ncbi:MAG: nucleoside-diphosphate sugar epimerase/dehydratase [Merdibacter sp.]
MINYILKNPLYKKYRELLISLIDLLIVAVSYFCAFFIVTLNFRFSAMAELTVFSLLQGVVLLLACYFVSFMAFRINRSMWKYTGPSEVMHIVAAVIMAMILTLIFRPLVPIRTQEVRTIVVTGMFVILLMCCVRLAYRLLRRREAEVNRTKNALIIGAGDGGYILCREIMQNRSIDAHVVGFVDDARVGKIVYGKKVLCDTLHMGKIVEKYDVQMALIAIPSASTKDIRRIYELCRGLNLEVKIMKKGDSMLESADAKKRYPVEDINIEDLLGRGEIHLDQHEVSSYLSGKTVAVTGAGGSIGSELCRQIMKFHPKELVMIDINENSLYMLEQEFNRARIHHRLYEDIVVDSYIASIRDRISIDYIFRRKQPDVVFHAAAHKHVPLMETRPMEAIKNNVFGTNNVIQCCIRNKVPRFIMISTDKAVNPTNVMGATKRMTEMILQANGDNGVTKMAAVRFGNVLGSNGSVIPIFRNQIREGGPVTITDRNITRYFMTIPEAAQLVLQAGYYADRGEVFVLDMGDPVKILDLAEKMIRLAGLEPYKDIDIMEIGLRPGEKMFEELRLDGEDTERTKNDLIFVNHVMRITRTEIDGKLDELARMIADKVPEPQLKQRLLEMIHDHEKQAENA